MPAHTNHHLDNDLRAIESDFLDLSPHPLPQDLLERMEAELSGLDVLGTDDGLDSVCVVDGDLNELEIHLTQLSASAMPEDMLTRMSEAMDRWQDHVPAEGKVVSLSHQKTRQKTRVFSGGMLSAAAAVAVLGAVAALAWPQVKVSDGGTSSLAQVDQIDRTGVESTASVTMNNPSLQSTPVALESSVMGATSASSLFAPRAVSTHRQPVNVMSGALTHNVTSAYDRGVIFSKDNVPHRCIRIDYVDRIKGLDAKGHEVEIKTPGVDFMLIPVETD